MRTIFVHMAALLVTIAAALFILAILIVPNGVKNGQVLSLNAPMPWAIIFGITGLVTLFASRRMQHDS